MVMPGRKFATLSSNYRYAFNGQEKSEDVIAGNYTAEFWEYDSRTGRRWNLDPKPTLGISDFSVLGNNPIINIDPNGDLFFGLFGSTSAQRQSAKKLRHETGGKISNMYKKNINVKYSIWGDESQFTFQQGTSSDPTRLRGVVTQAYRTYFDRKTGNENGVDYYDPTLKAWKHYETVSTYKPDIYNEWSTSKNVVKKFAYSTVNSFYVTSQNLFTKRFTDNSTANLTGELTTPTQNIEEFTSVTANFIPLGKGAKGLTYLEKLNAAQFSKICKGTIIARSAPFIRGKLNKGLNYVFSQYNDFIPSGAVVPSLVEAIKPKDENK
jgi:hypothetical protein